LIDNLDLSAMSGVYRGSGSAGYHPRLLLGILVYGYATGVFSSRKLERATYDSVLSASSPPTIILITTPSPVSGDVF
jgi:transposase